MKINLNAHSADSGHYYSFIRERGGVPQPGGSCSGVVVGSSTSEPLDPRIAASLAQAEQNRQASSDQWFEFNDSSVTVWLAVLCLWFMIAADWFCWDRVFSLS